MWAELDMRILQRLALNLHKDTDIYLKTKLTTIVRNVKPNDKKNLN